jgi:hypothetical protein
MYLGITFNWRITWGHHIKRTVAEALRMYIRTYSLFRHKRLSTNIELMLYKALIRSVMTYACPTWEYAVPAHLLKLQHMENRVLHAIGNLGRWQPISEFHVAFKIPYVYDYVTTLCRTHAEVILNHVNPNVHGT